jgi:hypothetical protein
MVDGGKSGNLLHGLSLLCNNVNDILVCRMYKPDGLECIPLYSCFCVIQVTRVHKIENSDRYLYRWDIPMGHDN